MTQMFVMRCRILYRRNRGERPPGPETNGSNVTLRMFYANQLDALKHSYLRQLFLFILYLPCHPI